MSGILERDVTVDYRLSWEDVHVHARHDTPVGRMFEVLEAAAAARGRVRGDPSPGRVDRVDVFLDEKGNIISVSVRGPLELAEKIATEIVPGARRRVPEEEDFHVFLAPGRE